MYPFLEQRMNPSYAQFLLDNPEQEDLSIQPNDMDIVQDFANSQAQTWWSGRTPMNTECPHHIRCLSSMTRTLSHNSSELSPSIFDSAVTQVQRRSGTTTSNDEKLLVGRDNSDQPIAAVSHSAVDQNLSGRRRCPRRRTPHKLVECRYRETLNGQFDALKLKVPRLVETEKSMSSTSDSDEVDDLAQLPYKTPTKGTIMMNAVEYIDELTAEKEALNARVARLSLQVDGLQKLVHCEDCLVMQTSARCRRSEIS